MIGKISILLIVYFSLFLSQIIVNTPCGPILGNQFDGVTYYEGVAFGKSKRFEHSTTASCWKGTFDATKLVLGPACFGIEDNMNDMSEDCLNLNIYKSSTHNDSNNLLPVILFVYGGGNTNGANSHYNIKHLAKLMPDVLFVVPNYRLGFLGFFANQANKLTGNYGVGDIITALKFIKPLLSSFGGDQTRITLLGHSSGGTNIFALMGSNMSQGLFHRSISLSGSPNISQSLSDASYLHRKYFLPAVGCDVPDSLLLKCLSQRSPQNLTKGLSNYLGSPPSVNPSNLPYSPDGNNLIGLAIVDGFILKTPIETAYRRAINDIPFVIQTMRTEMDPSFETVDKMNSLQTYNNWLQNYFFNKGWSSFDASKMANKLIVAYRDELNQTIELGFESWLSDMGVTCGSDRLAMLAAMDFRNPVYRTVNTFQDNSSFLVVIAPPSSPIDGKRRYPFHGWDMPIASTYDWPDGFKPQPSDLNLGISLRSMWRTIAYHGRLPGGYNSRGACTAVGPNGWPGKCPWSKCSDLIDLGIGDARFWWPN